MTCPTRPVAAIHTMNTPVKITSQRCHFRIFSIPFAKWNAVRHARAVRVTDDTIQTQARPTPARSPAGPTGHRRRFAKAHARWLCPHTPRPPLPGPASPSTTAGENGCAWPVLTKTTTIGLAPSPSCISPDSSSGHSNAAASHRKTASRRCPAPRVARRIAGTLVARRQSGAPASVHRKREDKHDPGF